MSIYLGYVAGGVCRDTHAPTKDEDGNPVKAPMVSKQFWVKKELEARGITAWCGKRAEFKRVGKDRDWTRFDVPALPNYIILDMDPIDMFTASEVDHIMPTFSLISGAALHGHQPTKEVTDSKGNVIVSAKPRVIGLNSFISAVEAEFSAAERVDANSRASVTEYKAGQSLLVVSGPFADMLVTFDKMVKAPHDPWHRVSAELESGHRVQFDPLDVRRA